MPTLTSRLLAALLTLLGLSQAALGSAQETGQPIVEGMVEYEIDYEDLGALSALMPKNQRLFFRPGQRRIEMGDAVTLFGVEEGKQVQLMDLGGLKVALIIPETTAGSGDNDLRLANTQEQQEIAGLQARRIDLVDALDPTNRLPVWITDQIETQSAKLHPDLKGFALDYYQPIQDGMGHWRAQRFSSEKLDPILFTIPSDHQRVDLESTDQISSALQDLLGGDSEVKVVQ